MIFEKPPTASCNQIVIYPTVRFVRDFGLHLWEWQTSANLYTPVA